eukprot:1161955-Pelagomonas_calceolata.AAC.5
MASNSSLREDFIQRHRLEQLIQRVSINSRPHPSHIASNSSSSRISFKGIALNSSFRGSPFKGVPHPSHMASNSSFRRCPTVGAASTLGSVFRRTSASACTRESEVEKLGMAPQATGHKGQGTGDMLTRPKP